MINILFCANGATLLLLYRILNQRVGRIMAIVCLVYLTVFTLLKPALMYYADLYAAFSTNDESTMEALLCGSLIFLVIQVAALQTFAKLRAPAFIGRSFDFDFAKPIGVGTAFAILMAVSFVGCSIRFGTGSYLFSNIDTFEAAMAQANGSYYINYVAESLTYGLLMMVGYTYWRYPAGRSFAIMFGLLALTYFWTKTSNRTGVLVIIIVWMSCFFSAHSQQKARLVYIGLAGYLLLVLLYVGNFVRTGTAAEINWNTAIFGAVTAAAADLVPVDNAAKLYSEMATHDSTYFSYLMGAISPLVLVPSSLFPFKPSSDKDAELTRIFFPNGADTAFFHEGSTLTFTIPASGYADAGYLGVLVASALYALLLCWYVWVFRNGSRSARLIGAYMVLGHIIGYRLSIESLIIWFYSSILFFGLTRWLARTPGDDARTRLAPAPA